MADLEVNIEPPAETDTETAHPDTSTHDSVAAGATVEAASQAAENKAHSEHSAAEAGQAAGEAHTHSSIAQDAADQANHALNAMQSIADSVVTAVESIPDKIASALHAQVKVDEAPTLETPQSTGDPITPAVPPAKKRFKDFYYGRAGK